MKDKENFTVTVKLDLKDKEIFSIVEVQSKELERLQSLMKFASQSVCHHWHINHRNKDHVSKVSSRAEIRCWDLNIANDWWCPPCVCLRALHDEKFTVKNISADCGYRNGKNYLNIQEDINESLKEDQ